MTDAIGRFRAAIEARGLMPKEIDADGRLHRCKVAGGKSGNADGSFVLHPGDPAAGWFMNWRDGLGGQTWCSRSSTKMSAEQRQTLREQVAAIRESRGKDEAARQNEAARRADKLLSLSKPATDAHPYLLKKGVHAYGIHQLREQLVVPVRTASGRLTTLQFIAPNGNKRFLTGGRKRGCYFAIGTPRGVLCICEGYATAASVFDATGHATAVAFDAGNLEPVAMVLRGKFPDAQIILAADNDAGTPGNPGVSCAIAAARAVRGLVAIPQFGGSA